MKHFNSPESHSLLLLVIEILRMAELRFLYVNRKPSEILSEFTTANNLRVEDETLLNLHLIMTTLFN